VVGSFTPVLFTLEVGFTTLEVLPVDGGLSPGLLLKLFNFSIPVLIIGLISSP